MTKASNTHNTTAPERFKYKDRGCKLAPACLECPFERCKDELPPGQQQKIKRDAYIYELVSEGLRTAEIALKIGLSERNIDRAIEAHRRRISL